MTWSMDMVSTPAQVNARVAPDGSVPGATMMRSRAGTEPKPSAIFKRGRRRFPPRYSQVPRTPVGTE